MAVRFAVAADTHVSSPKDMGYLQEDISFIDDVDFIVINGDLTVYGHEAEFFMYKEAIKSAKAPVFSVFGGHDGNYLKISGDVDPTRTFVENLGPVNHFFDKDNVRFIFLLSETGYLSRTKKQLQDDWLNSLIKDDFNGNIIVFCHEPLTEDHKVFDLPGLKAVFYAHSHMFNIYNKDGVMIIKVPPLCFGGYSGFLRGYMKACIDKENLNFRFIPLPAEVEVGGIMNTLSGPVVTCKGILTCSFNTSSWGGVLKLSDRVNNDLIWICDLESAVYHTPVVVENKIYLIESSGILDCIDLNTGAVLWEKTDRSGYDRHIMHGICVIKNKVWLRSEDSISCFNKDNETSIWKSEYIHSDWMGSCSSPVLFDDKIICGALRGDGITAFNADTGEIVWNTGGKVNGFERVSAGIAISKENNMIYICAFNVLNPQSKKDGSSEGIVCALSADDGSTIWKKKCGSYNYTDLLVLKNILVLSDPLEGRINFYNNKDGCLLRSFTAKESIYDYVPGRRSTETVFSSPVTDGEGIFFGAGNGHLYMYDPLKEELYDSGYLGVLSLAPPAVDKDHVYANIINGESMRFDRRKLWHYM